MRLYRIAPEQFLEDYRGLGASYRYGARWNLPGQPVPYFGTAAGIALLEMANYLPSPRLVPEDYRLDVYEISDSIELERWGLDDLPSSWNAHPQRAETQAMGSQWLAGCRTAVLKVPGAAVPNGLECNIVVNPLHPEVVDGSIQLVESYDKIYSDRVFPG